MQKTFFFLAEGRSEARKRQTSLIKNHTKCWNDFRKELPDAKPFIQ